MRNLTTSLFQNGALLAWLALPALCVADTAIVLPKNTFNFYGKYYYYPDITERFNQDGDAEPLAIDLNGSLDSSVFPSLKRLNALVPGGNAKIGDSVVDFTYKYQITEFELDYGVTDRLSLGAKMYYYWAENEVNSHLDVSRANVGKNPLYGTRFDRLRSPLIPLRRGGVPLTDADARNLLSQGVDVNGDGVVDIPGYGFKPFKSWSDSGIGDLEAGAKYQFLNQSPWRLALAGGLRFPTGRTDDPDDLADLSFGDGQTDLLFRFYGDYTGINRLLLNTELRYDISLPDSVVLRVPEATGQPLTANQEEVDRRIGDFFRVEVMGAYSLTPQWSTELKYRYFKKFKDDISGSEGSLYAVLEDETDLSAQEVEVGIGYATLNLFREKKTSVPWYAVIAYRNRFAGTNTTKSEYVSVQLGFLF